MSLATEVNMKHAANPIIVGTSMETAVHLRLCVSFFMVRQVVEHGQCISENSITLIAVIHVHPLSISNCFNSVRSSNSKIFPFAIYAIIMIGITISFAGKPRIKASRITPSIPKSFANGSKKPEQCASSVISPIQILAMSHMTRPAGAATDTARPRTKSVLSNIERTMTFPI